MKTSIRSILKQKGSTVHAVRPDSTVYDALKKMADTNVGALLVMDGERLAGIVSERDYARKVILKGRSSLDTRVEDIMSTRVICARPEQTVEECMGLMTAKAVRHLPVLDHKEVVGIVSIGDLVKAIIGEQQHIIEQLENYIHGH
jgi:CBS domain-containing protein